VSATHKAKQSAASGVAVSAASRAEHSAVSSVTVSAASRGERSAASSVAACAASREEEIAASGVKESLASRVTKSAASRVKESKASRVKESDASGVKDSAASGEVANPASIHSIHYCVQLEAPHATSTNTLSRHFRFPPKKATIPISAAGLLYLTLDRRTQAGGDKENAPGDFCVRRGDILASCELVEPQLQPFYPCAPSFSLRGLPVTLDMAAWVTAGKSSGVEIYFYVSQKLSGKCQSS